MENQINHNKSSCKLQYKKCGLYQIKHYHFALVDSTNQWAKGAHFSDGQRAEQRPG